MRENKDKKTPNTDTFYLVTVSNVTQVLNYKSPKSRENPTSNISDIFETDHW